MGEIIQMKKNESTSKETHVSENISSNMPKKQVPKSAQTRSMGLNQEQYITQASSSNGPSTTDSTAKEVITVKKGRGPAQFPRGWGTGKKFEVTLDGNARVVGLNVNQYKTGMGCLARIGSKLPLNYVEFTDIPQYMRDMVWEEVEYNTTLPPEAMSVVLTEINEVWRKWKHEIKTKYFLPHNDDEDYLAKLPTTRIEMEQWLELVQYWKDKGVQEIADQNAINVEKKQALHRTGKTSFALLEQEIMMKGILEPTGLDFWMESRSRGKGIEDDVDTLDLYNHFTQELSKKLEEERTKEFKDQIFYSAMGDGSHNRMKCTGRTRKHAATQALSSLQREKEELQKLKDGITEKMQQVQEDFFHEKEQLLLKKEKVSLLTKKFEAMISQYPAFPHGPQVLESSTLNQTTLIRQRDSPSFEEEQSAAGRCKKQKSLQDYLKPIKIGARLHLFCHGVPKQIVAEGIVVSIIEERGVEPRFVKVYIEKAVMPNEKLTRSQEDVRKIGDAVHKCIEWEIVNVMEI